MRQHIEKLENSVTFKVLSWDFGFHFLTTLLAVALFAMRARIGINDRSLEVTTEISKLCLLILFACLAFNQIAKLQSLLKQIRDELANLRMLFSIRENTSKIFGFLKWQVFSIVGIFASYGVLQEFFTLTNSFTIKDRLAIAIAILSNGLLSPAWQEFVYRGVVWNAFAQRSVYFKTMACTVPFVVFHYFLDMNFQRTPYLIAFSLMACLARIKTGLVGAIVMHAVANTIATSSLYWI